MSLRPAAARFADRVFSPRRRSAVRRFVKTTPSVRGVLFLAQNAFAVIRRGTMKIPRNLAEAEPDYFCVAFARAFNEGSFIKEWVAYHSALGIEHFYIYDNLSTDDTVEQLAPAVDEGLVTIIPWPTRPTSPSCYFDFFRTTGFRSVWVACLDIDEFVVPMKGISLRQVLVESSTFPAVAVNFLYYGSSSYRTIPDGLVTENFVLSDAVPDEHVKVIVQSRAVRRYRNPHNFYYRRGRLARTTWGNRVLGSFSRPLPGASLILNHYVYRSAEDYARKVERGAATTTPRDRQRSFAALAAEFTLHNDCYRPMSPTTLEDVREVLARWSGDAGAGRTLPR